MCTTVFALVGPNTTLCSAGMEEQLAGLADAAQQVNGLSLTTLDRLHFRKYVMTLLATTFVIMHSKNFVKVPVK